MMPLRSRRRRVPLSDFWVTAGIARFYVTGWAPEKIEAFMAGIHAVAEEIALPLPRPPASLIGVDFLFEPDVLVEIEATAVLD